MTYTFHTVTGDAARVSDELLDLCRVAFEDFSPDYLTARVVHVAAPALVTARFAHGPLAGFKLGYRRGASLFYSWLGAVHPDARRQGLAAELMRRQHEWARSQGYTEIETQTRAVNNAMIILNLKSGFRVRGFGLDSLGREIVVQRKKLGEDASR
jgi:predicted GNAT superfamily acetyltransferase